jgi:hypothetical protein
MHNVSDIFVSLATAMLILAGCAQATPKDKTATLPPPAVVSPSPTPLSATPTPVPIPCSVQMEQYWQQAQALLKQFDDTNTLAGSTARIALSQPVGKLQDTRRQLDAVDAPKCAKSIKMLIITYMDAVIDSYLAFMQQASDSQVSAMLAKTRLLRNDLQASVQQAAKSDKPLSAYNIEYRAGGVDWFQVIYKTASGNLSNPEYFNAPWHNSFVYLEGQSPELTVYHTASKGEVFCELWIDGKLVDRQTASRFGDGIICYQRLQ